MKTRLDIRMTELNLSKSREQARAFIMAGLVLVDGQKADKAGTFVTEFQSITVKPDAVPFVSRGGLKLQKALQVFPIDLSGMVAADIGASTGGFTDCMLQHGAKRVYAVDVGYGQLDWKLRNDERVHVMERTNARYMEPSWYAEPLDFASIDVSFISLDKMLPPLYSCQSDAGQVIALIKPQFEAGRGKVGKHGVVSDENVHIEVCENVLRFAQDAGYYIAGLSFSPIKGPKGNIEFLLWLTKFSSSGPTGCIWNSSRVADVVVDAHRACILA
ncbi:MAG: TlyA family RNA methyltransferase [Clostridia bacterium]